jgi:cytochrome oxidase Cu insertion factor (SCO1/SenC/PrrC family)
MVLAALAYWLGWAPGTSDNYGELIAPRVLPDAELARAEGAAFRLSELRGRWVMVQVDTPACDQYCERKLYFMRQVRRALGADAGRVERLWLLSGPGEPSARLLAAIEGTRVVRHNAGLIAALPARERTGDHIYLIDPGGALMMRFPRDPDPGAMVKDLRRLLRYSRPAS